MLRLRIASIDRLPNSVNGNPRYRIAFVDDGGVYDGAWNTATDHAFAYEIGNRGRRVGDEVIVTIGGRGTIIDLSDVAA